MRKPRVVVLFVALAMLASLGGAAAANPTPAPTVGGLVGASQTVFVAVELGLQPTTVIYRDQLAQHGSTTVAGAQAINQLSDVENEQYAFRAQLVQSGLTGVTELYSLQRITNAVVFATSPDKVSALSKLPGVKAVHTVKVREIVNAYSVPFIGGQATWAGTPAATGLGMKIGIIDTGIDYLHTNFGGSGLAADYQAADTNTPALAATPPLCPDNQLGSSKVVGGIDLAGAAYDVVNNPEIAPAPDCDPMGFHPHGTHVAGTAAGFGVKTDGTTYTGPWTGPIDADTLSIGPGVAPQASLYGIKITGDNQVGSSYLVAAGVEWALDPNGDGDPSDHLDVVNISFGGNMGQDSDFETTIFSNAVQAGLLMAISQGNSGDYYFYGGNPGGTPEAVTVAASMHNHTYNAYVVVNSPTMPNIVAWTQDWGAQLTSTPLTADLIYVSDDDSEPYPNNVHDGCDPSADGAYAGKIALVDRGNCSFTEKVYHAQKAGALAVIIANNAPGSLAMAYTAQPEEIVIPVVGISQLDGNTLKTALSGVVNVSLVKLLEPSWADTLADFSSRGPTRVGGQAVLKPDISAPGFQVMSSVSGMYSGSGSAGESWPGTSMAAPHIAGSLALLKQLHPTWTTAEIKALLMNTADHDVFAAVPHSATTRIGPARVGAGRVDLVPATGGEVIAYDRDYPERVSVSFALTDVVGHTGEARVIQLKNKGSVAKTYTMSFDPVTAVDGASVYTVSSTTVAVPANSTTNVTIVLEADSTIMVRQHDQTVAEEISGYARYWLAEQSGYVVLTPTSGGAEPTLRVPYYAALNPSSDMSTTGFVDSLPPTGSTTLPLDGQGIFTFGAANPPYGVISAVTPFELVHASPNEPPVDVAMPADYDPRKTNMADIKHVGVTGDYPSRAGVLDNAWVFFAVETYGMWGSPDEVWIEVDVKRRSAPGVQWAFLNMYPGAWPSGDQFAVYGYRVANGRWYGIWDLNVVYAGGLYLPTALSDTMVFAVPAYLFGLTPGDSELEFQVFSGHNYFSGTVDASPLLHYNVEQPGFDFMGGATPSSTDYPELPLYADLPGEEVPVNFNLDAVQSNATGAVLLLHWMNAAGKRGELVPIPSITCQTDVECLDPAKPYCDPLSGVCMVCRANSQCDGGEYCDTYGTRTCVAACDQPFARPCPAGFACNATTKACQVPLSLIRQTPLDPGDASCPYGGVKVEAGVDLNLNGKLDDDEVTSTSNVCHGTSSLVVQTAFNPGADNHCPNGGVKIDVGIDDNRDGALQSGEIDSTTYVCNGLPSLVKAVDIPANTGPCANGGQIIYAGVDDNANHDLEESEYDTFWYACNGLDGHTSLLKTTDEQPGENCAAGGKKVETGVDDNGDGVLQTAEVDHMEYVCNGVAGADGKQALVSITDEPAGDNCPVGGKKVEAGLDADGNGVLDAAEVDSTSYVCNGSDGETGADGPAGAQPLVETSPLLPGADCAAGGILVKSGLDLNGDGRLDASEVTSNTAICTGTKGKGCSAAPSPASAGPLALLLLAGLLVLRRQ